MTAVENAQIKSHDDINTAFTDFTVTRASKKQLQRWLVTLCTLKMESSENTDRNKMRAAAIQHLLASRLAVESHRRSFWLSMAAFIVSFASLVLAVINAKL